MFCGRRRHTIKILYFDRSGFCLWQKQLDVESSHGRGNLCRK
ncbi:MAG: IS66 family insertion sequence element accessory protein TnpB [Bdellovibrionales bacterium]|nr:IS66 family insertion sequence element accessory protein TnpB [Bdellovibrionales bacterium]